MHFLSDKINLKFYELPGHLIIHVEFTKNGTFEGQLRQFVLVV